MDDTKNTLDSYPKAVQDFAIYKRTVQRRSSKTVAEYLVDLRMFCRYMKLKTENRPINDETLKSADITDLPLCFFQKIKTEDVYVYLKYIADNRQNKSVTQARKLSAIRSFYKYLTVQSHSFEENPVKDIEAPVHKNKLPKYLSLEECIRLLTAVKTDEKSKTRERDNCILTFFLNCGIRLSELAGISLRDIDPEMRSMRVLGKGSKERIVYLNDACRNALRAYQPARNRLRRPGAQEDALFLSSRGRRISVKTVQWMVKKYLDMAGLAYKNYSTHKLRHTAATLLYQSGQVDTRVLQEILGHEQLNTTQIYTHVSNESMESAMEKTPLANLYIEGIAPVPAAMEGKDDTKKKQAE